jgi:hypothetical protein
MQIHQTTHTQKEWIFTLFTRIRIKNDTWKHVVEFKVQKRLPPEIAYGCLWTSGTRKSRFSYKNWDFSQLNMWCIFSRSIYIFRMYTCSIMLLSKMGENKGGRTLTFWCQKMREKKQNRVSKESHSSTFRALKLNIHDTWYVICIYFRFFVESKRSTLTQ